MVAFTVLLFNHSFKKHSNNGMLFFFFKKQILDFTATGIICILSKKKKMLFVPLHNKSIGDYSEPCVCNISNNAVNIVQVSLVCVLPHILLRSCDFFSRFSTENFGSSQIDLLYNPKKNCSHIMLWSLCHHHTPPCIGVIVSVHGYGSDSVV